MISDLFTLAWLILTLFCALCVHARDDRIRGLERTVDHLILALADVRDERDTAARQLAHVQDNMSVLLALAAEMERDDDDDDAEDILSQVEAFLSEVTR